MKTIKNILFSFVAIFSVVSAQTLFAEPPNTEWTVTGSSTLTITEVVEEGATPWKFELPKAGGTITRKQTGSSTKLNFRTLVPHLPEGCKITSVNGNAFKSNTTIVELYWPDTITSIAANSFLNCSNLKICDYPEGTKITSIGSSAFQSCSKLTRLRICETLNSVGLNAFYGLTKVVFDGPMLPPALKSLPNDSFCPGESAAPLADGLLVIGSSGEPFTWNARTSNRYNRYFSRFNITNLVFGAGVEHAGTNSTSTIYNPFHASSKTGSSITNIVVQNSGVFAFSTVLTAAPTHTDTIRQYDVAGWITGTLVANATARKTRINAAKNKYWQEFLRTVTPADYREWKDISDASKAEYWQYFNGGVEGTGNEIPHGIVLYKTSYTITVDGETMLPLTIPGDVWVVFNKGDEWPAVLTPIEIPVAIEGLSYTGSEQIGVLEGEGYTLEGHKATDAGFYTATATLKNGYKWANGSSDPVTITWSIGVVQVPVVIDGLRYTGNEQTGVVENEAYILTGHKATEVGTYEATATLNNGFVWPDGTKEQKTVQWAIGEAAVQIPDAVTGLKYTGSEQTGVVEASGYTLEGHKATNVGTYTATATLVDSEHYEWADGTKEPKTIIWTIEGTKIPVAVTGLQYNGKTQTGVKSGTGYTLTGNTGKAVGTYTATATLLDGYMWEDGTTEEKSIVWSIGEEERDPEPEPLPEPEPDTVDAPASIIYVNPSATGANNGTSWTDAYTNFKTALSKITAEKNVIWFAGTFTCSADCVVTIPSGVKAKIRGGFKGSEVTAAEREEGVKSVVSGNVRAYKTLEITSDSALRIERIRFVDSKDRGIYKKGEGDLILLDCDIVGCGLFLGNVLGRGLYMTGTADKTRLFAERCTFSGNRYGGAKGQNSLGSGHGAALIDLARATFDDCLFVTNGLSIVSSPADNDSGLNFFKGSALYAENAPVTARGTKFIGNRGWCSQSSAPSSDSGLMGGTVRLESVAKESAFTNCLWLANQSTIALSVHENYGGGGEIFFNPGKTYAKCDVVNCTFAASLNDIWRNGSRGVNVRSGKVKILNSIFGCNVRTRVGENVGEDIYVADGAEVYASYSMFTPDKSGDKALYAAGPGTLTLGEGVVFDEPKFISRVDEARYMLGNKFRANYYLSVALDYLINFNVHLRSVAGYYDFGQNKRIRSYSENSLALDAGDPKSDYSKEPHTSWGYHGRRVNMGFYGNTPEAAATRYKGFFVKVVGGESTPKEEVEVIGKPDNTVPVEDIIVCDGVGDSVKIYRGNEVVWKWTAKSDKAIPSAMSTSYFKGITEARISDYNNKKVVAISSSDCTWAIVDIATTNAIAYGYSRTAGQSVSTSIMPHSIAILPNDIVAVASTYTADQNAPETKYGCYFYHIAGDKAKSYQDPAKQGATFFSIENPHGFYWDNDNKKLYVSSSEGLTRLNVTFNSEENKFDIVEEAVFGIAQLGAKWGHDLAVVPGTRILAMTTYEMTLFFDMDKEQWLLDEIVWRMDQKGFDPHEDKIHFLATVPRANYVTDTLEVWTKENGFVEYLKVPGAEFYKARWAGGVLDSVAK